MRRCDRGRCDGPGRRCCRCADWSRPTTIGPCSTASSLDVGEHEVVVLIGASGSGKSTLLRCIDLLEDIDDGQILLDGRDISDPRIDADDARQAMGMVFQSFNLFPHMTALANVALAPRVVHGSTRRDAEERGRELLARVGLVRQGRCLSGQAVRRTAAAGGHRTRVGLRAPAVAARRDHQRAGSGTGRRGAGPRRRIGHLGPHHRDGHPRNGASPARWPTRCASSTAAASSNPVRPNRC